MRNAKRNANFTILVLALLGIFLAASGCGSSSGGDNNVVVLTAPKALIDPATIPKFVQPLFIPPAMPYKSKTAEFTEYHIAVRQFQQQVLPPGYPMTTGWGYGVADDPLPGLGIKSTYHFPGATIEARRDEKVRVTWVNGLVDGGGNYLPHLLPVDQTLHWANPPGPRDGHSMDSGQYTGPVPLVTHLHGAHVNGVSDGYPESWYLPNANNIPTGYFTQGTHYGSVVTAGPGSAVYEYPNDQPAATLWYHDHALGITRLNNYMGINGLYVLRDSVEDSMNLPGPAPQVFDLPGARYYEIPIVIQDRTFWNDGSLFYPGDRAFFDGFTGPFYPTTDVHPVWNPEAFGDTLVVNGNTWPYLEVEPRLYRFRILNGSNARTYILQFDQPGLNFIQIGGDQGFLPNSPVVESQVVLSSAERADVIVDFSSFNPGDEIILQNIAPDEPYKGPNPPEVQAPADPLTTGQVMKFKVVPSLGWESGTVPVSLPAITPLTTALPPRDLTLNELVYLPDDIPYEALLGTLEDGPLEWDQTITETVNSGDTEIWRIINLTEDSHPIHVHLVRFQVLDRTPLDVDGFITAQQAYLNSAGPLPVLSDYFTGPAVPPDPSEMGPKDTVRSDPGMVTRFIATFDLVGLFVWHCHILEHEDNEMMRPFEVQ